MLRYFRSPLRTTGANAINLRARSSWATLARGTSNVARQRKTTATTLLDIVPSSLHEASLDEQPVSSLSGQRPAPFASARNILLTSERLLNRRCELRRS